jgi:hypothetical protein
MDQEIAIKPSRIFSFLLEALKRTLPEQPFRRDVPVFNIGVELRFNPCGLGLFNRLRQFRLRADHGVELLPDLA